MSGSHAELGPELRALAQSILDKLDPAIRLAAARAQAAGGPGPCQQVWCPVCALAALISGEQHPLLTVVAEHSVALLTLLKAMVEDMEAAPAAAESPHPPDPSPDDPGPPDPAPPDPPGRYQHIPVSIDE
ncbi:hypothetical protein CYL16_24425 [Mycobacterium sp. EPG1]|nr:hypothetical protein CYL16_24425 [Mycobacterium sp. EPG1]